MDRRRSSLNRSETLAKLQAENFDLIVIGSGITGGGIALDAASRGMKVALIGMQDFGAGTSSRPSKVIHGRLRYLKKLSIGLISQTNQERTIVYENGPHVTTPEWMVLPIYKNGSVGKFTTSIGLHLYDFFARVKKEERKSMMSKEKTLQLEPMFKREGLLGGGRFVEYRSDDARLTIEVMKEAVAQGATVLNYTQVDDFIYKNGQVVGVSTVDQLSGEQSVIQAKKIINATEPWIDPFMKETNSSEDKQSHVTNSVHLIFNQTVFPLQQSIYFDSLDGRTIVAIPLDGKTYIGTTDTEYSNQLTPTEERDNIIKAIRHTFPDLKIQSTDVEACWTGLMPLNYTTKDTSSEASSKKKTLESSSGLLTISSGKSTGYRKLAETVVNQISIQIQARDGQRFIPCQTKNMPISGGHVGGSKKFKVFMKKKIKQGVSLGLHRNTAYQLVKKYGSNIDKLYAIIQSEKAKDEAEAFGLPVDIYAQVLYAIYDEFTCTLVDFFWRRTGTLLFDMDWLKTWRFPITELMSAKLRWSSDEKKQFDQELDRHLNEMLVTSQ